MKLNEWLHFLNVRVIFSSSEMLLLLTLILSQHIYIVKCLKKLDHHVTRHDVLSLIEEELSRNVSLEIR